MSRPALAIVLVMLLGSFTPFSAASDPAPAMEPALFELTVRSAGWVLVDADVLPGGRLLVAMEGVNGRAPVYSALYVFDADGQLLGGGDGIYDGRTEQDERFIDVGVAGLSIPGLPSGRPAGEGQSPDADGAAYAPPDEPARYRVLAYGGGAGDPDIRFVVKGTDVANVTAIGGGGYFATEDDLAAARARAEDPLGVAVAASAMGSHAQNVTGSLFGYFGILSSEQSVCTASCVSTQDSAVLQVFRETDSSTGSVFEFFDDPGGAYEFRLDAHAGVGNEAQPNLCGNGLCVEADFTPRPMVILLVVDVPF